MSTAIYTRHLVEHRYGRPLEDLQLDGAHGGSGDPVLPIVLRRLGGLAETNARARAAHRHLDAAWQRCRSGEHALDDLVLRYAAEVVDLERQEQSEAEAVWDLLDVRLLLDQPAGLHLGQPDPRRAMRTSWPSPAKSPHVCPDSTAKPCAKACATEASTSATAASARCSSVYAPSATLTDPRPAARFTLRHNGVTTMSTLEQPAPSQIGSVDAQRVEDALSLIAPKWTTWSAQTLAQQGGPMRVRDVAARLPFLSEQLVGKRLAQMHADGLVTRAGDRRGAPYQLSGFGNSLSSVHRALSDWSQANLPLGNVAGAERVEDAVRRLHLRHSTAVIQVLGAGGPMRFVHIAEEAGLDNGFTGSG
ncbi:winged helix-turn-helix transcriptional regulator [Streptomyces sp. NPDC005195]|uniref:winged helix-turn-helix transcriptional regulator n=1 Tax=Streptomyces sp. NPDC005195 TaxID=3154561 RepID=UPI0033B16B4A